jgi:hypothetical protein
MQLFREFMPDVAYQSLFPHRDLRADVRSRDQPVVDVQLYANAQFYALPPNRAM